MGLRIDYPEYFQGLSDRELDNAILVFTEMRCDEGNMNLIDAETMAVGEWQFRYPDKIAPCIYDRAIEKGGFPSCYAGPRETIDLEKDED